jgi:hypothetical protein
VEPPFAGCGRPFSLKAVFHVKHGSWETTRIRFGKAGAHPQLAWESQLPLKPYPSLQSFHFKRQLRFFRFALRCLFPFMVQFDLLSKCGLLAHTSAAFLKNCCTEKLLVACGSYFTTTFVYFQCTKKPLPNRSDNGFLSGFLQ